MKVYIKYLLLLFDKILYYFTIVAVKSPENPIFIKNAGCGIAYNKDYKEYDALKPGLKLTGLRQEHYLSDDVLDLGNL